MGCKTLNSVHIWGLLSDQTTNKIVENSQLLFLHTCFAFFYRTLSNSLELQKKKKKGNRRILDYRLSLINIFSQLKTGIHFIILPTSLVFVLLQLKWNEALKSTAVHKLFDIAYGKEMMAFYSFYIYFTCWIFYFFLTFWHPHPLV